MMSTMRSNGSYGKKAAPAKEQQPPVGSDHEEESGPSSLERRREGGKQYALVLDMKRPKGKNLAGKSVSMKIRYEDEDLGTIVLFSVMCTVASSSASGALSPHCPTAPCTRRACHETL